MIIALITLAATGALWGGSWLARDHWYCGLCREWMLPGRPQQHRKPGQ